LTNRIHQSKTIAPVTAIASRPICLKATIPIRPKRKPPSSQPKHPGDQIFGSWIFRNAKTASFRDLSNPASQNPK
jgi:hypothetical protein